MTALNGRSSYTGPIELGAETSQTRARGDAS